jgi:L-rhamnose 1-dehydrogenase
MLLVGKRALVTGASRGIGRACAVALAREGARVAVNYPDASEEAAAAETLAIVKTAGGQAIGVRGDVSRQAEARAMFAETDAAFGGLDILVSNAGICPMAPFLEIDEALWDRVQDVNLKGAFFCCQEAARLMQRTRNGGRIIAISSISAIKGGSVQAHYGPTKAGLIALMASLAVSLGPQGITCNSVLPGTIETDLNKDYLTSAENRRNLEVQTCLGRLGMPDEVAGAVVFFASDLARYVTGATLLVDGGEFVKHL